MATAAFAFAIAICPACGSASDVSGPPAPAPRTITPSGPPLHLRATLTRSSPGDGAYVECNTFRGQLECLVYTAQPPPGAECSAGGAVATWTLSRSAPPRRAFTCVDEGSHDQPVLGLGREVAAGEFRCIHAHDGDAGTKLTCTDDSYRITVHANSAVETS